MGMLSSLIRRSGFGSEESTDGAFESTTVSLTTLVPRPTERRGDDRVDSTLRVAKLTSPDGYQQLIKVKNMSAGGLMAIVVRPPEVGSAVDVDMSAQKIPASVVWIRGDMVGFKFDEHIDLGELLAGRKQRVGFRHRPPRLDMRCKASVRVGKTYYQVEPIEEYCVGKKVIVVIESFGPVKGEVRWYRDRRAGIVFDKPLDFDQLSEWVGKRLEMASLKAATGR
jgi:hypothetical protein